MSWIVDGPLTYFQRFVLNILKCGPIPRHIAFIMDGNRRYATKNKVQKYEGHSRGFDKLAEALRWCRELGIKEVTVYAFSIENFKRTKDEVETLMQLACEKFEKFLDDREKIMKAGVCIRIIGNVELLSVRLKKLIAQAVLMTRDNCTAYLNVAFAYTSREEIATSVRTIVDGVKNERLNVNDIDEVLFGRCLYTGRSSNPDILIRTSGEVRFSDFLLWQISSAKICFDDVLWPDFSIWHLFYCVFLYQRGHSDLEAYKKWDDGEVKNENIDEFLIEVESNRIKQLQSYLKL